MRLVIIPRVHNTIRESTVNGESFAGPNFHGFRGFVEECESFSHQSLLAIYRMCVRGLFGSDFNLAVWQIFIGSPNLNYAILTPTHKMN